MSVKFTFSNMLLVLSTLLNLTGMASVVEGVVVWGSFFKNILDVYHNTIQLPFYTVISSIWPGITFPMVDLLVIWSTFYLAANLHQVVSGNGTMFHQSREAVGLPKAIVENMIIFIAGPAIFIFFILFCSLFSWAERVVKKRDDGFWKETNEQIKGANEAETIAIGDLEYDISESEFGWTRVSGEQVRLEKTKSQFCSILKAETTYLLFTVIGFLAILFANYQIQTLAI